MPRARIPNAELELLENNIATALSIMAHLKALIYWTDDPDQLRIMTAIMADAAELRTRNIAAMRRRKNERKNP